jgi:hypothetical protein
MCGREPPAPLDRAGQAVMPGIRTWEGAAAMAIYHCSIKIIGRSSGRSSVAAAAYRSGEVLHNSRDGLTHDYTRKGGVAYTEIMLPENAPEKYRDRQTLWNAVEAVEKSIRAQTAREIELALPVELDKREQIKLVQEYARTNFVERGMIADVAIHDKGDGNPHAHIMLTMRSLDKNGKWESKQRKEYIYDEYGNKQYDRNKKTYKCRSVPKNDWDDHANAELWREEWAENCNRFFIDNTIEASVDHRSFARQGIDRIPTVHLGAAHRIEKKGGFTDRGQINRAIKAENMKREMKPGRRSERKIWDEKKQAFKYIVYNPTTKKVNLIQSAQARAVISAKKLPGPSGLKLLKDVNNTLNFLAENKISSYGELEERLARIRQGAQDGRNGMKRLDFEINRLSKVIAAVEDHNQTVSIVRKVQSLAGHAREKYRHAHELDFIKFGNAVDLLRKNNFPTVPALETVRAMRQAAISERQELLATGAKENALAMNLANAKNNLDALLHRDAQHPINAKERVNLKDKLANIKAGKQERRDRPNKKIGLG